MSPAWLLFICYYLTTYIGSLAVLVHFFGAFNLAIYIATFAVLQLFRRIPIPPVQALICSLNYGLALATYRINYLITLTLSLTLALLPFLAAVLHAPHLGIPKPLAAVFLVVFFAAALRRRAVADRALAAENAAGKNSPLRQRPVAVIGGGVAGIVAAKEALDEGHTVVGFELASALGGVWNSHDGASKRTTGKTLSSSSRSNTGFGDFPMAPRSNRPGDAYPTHYTENDFEEYLAEYTRAFGVDKVFRLGTKVDSMHRSVDGEWVLESVAVNSGETVTERFDFVVVATGLNQAATGLKLNTSSGKSPIPLHTADYRGNEAYRDKKVVIVGLGESSTDTAADIALAAKEVHIIVRNPVLLLPRNTFGTSIAPDHKLSKLVLQCPMFVRTFKLLSQVLFHGPFNVFACRFLGLEGEFGTPLVGETKYEDNWSWGWWKLFMKLGPLHPAGGWDITRGQITKTAPVVLSYSEGKSNFHTSGIAETSGSAVFLEDGTVIRDVDAVVNATGYTTVWPFLEGWLKSHCHRDRYRMVFHPEMPDVAFIGFCRGGVGSIMQAIEMQARWSALVMSGKRTLPPPDEMRVRIQEHKQQMVGKWATKVTMVYCNAIARHEVGCEPDLWEVFWDSPRAWFYLVAGPYNLSMYRFRGPHKSRETAFQVYDEGAEIVRPLEYPLQQMLELALGSLCRFWTSLPPLSAIRLTGPMRQCVTPFQDLHY